MVQTISATEFLNDSYCMPCWLEKLMVFITIYKLL